MSAPLVHIFSADLKEGQLEGYRKYAHEHARFVETTHPRILAFHLYVDPGGRVSAVQVHPDVESMEFFMQKVVPEHGLKAYEFLVQGTERSEAYGALSDPIEQGLKEFGVAYHVVPEHLGGFTRLGT